MMYFAEDMAMTWICLFLTYEEITNRIAKGVGIPYEIIYYTSPTHTREASKTLNHLFIPLRITKAEADIFVYKLIESIAMANVIKLS